MSYRLFFRSVSFVALMLGASACGGDDVTTPISPTPPVAPMTETFSGSINRNGAATYPFTSQASGTVTATLTSVGPDSAAKLGFSLGTWNLVSCAVVIAKDDAIQGSVLTGGVTANGSLCVRVYDVGAIDASTPVSYQITVVHP